MFCGHKPWFSGDTMFLDCHVISQNYAIICYLTLWVKGSQGKSQSCQVLQL